MPDPATMPDPGPPPPAMRGREESPPPGAAPTAAAEGLTIKARGQFRMAAERFARHRVALAGLITFVALLLFATIGPLFWQYGYAQITGQFGTGPSLRHPFGTDQPGHDIFAQVMTGEATSVKTALLVAVIATFLGTLVGAIAGYYGGLVDGLLMRFTDLVLAVPLLVILLVLANRFSRTGGSWFWIAVILAFVLWTPLARLVRGSFLSLREREFVEAAHAIGASDTRIIVRHLIPNAIGSIVVNSTLTVGLAVLIESVLSFLGLGIEPPQVSLGNLIASGQDSATTQWWLFVFPAAFLVVTILAVNFIGDGLRDALDPQQRVRK